MKKLLTLISISCLTLGAVWLTSGHGVAQAAEQQTEVGSTATVNVAASNPDNPNPEDGQLLLKTVPDFNFGTLAAREIFNGVSNKAAKQAGKLTIVDNRLGSDQWRLSVKAGNFTRADQKSLATATLKMSAAETAGALAGQGTINGVVPTDGAAHVLTSNQTGNHGVTNFDFVAASNSLSLGATRNIALNQNDAFTAPLTWTLAPSNPVVPTL